MKKQILQYKKVSLAVLSSFLLLISFNAVAQKSVYDVIPGSGPKKKTESSLPGVINGSNKKNNDRGHNGSVYTGTRRNLPPGQAKKIYGGSAKDYAPGQLKKRNRYNDERWERDDDGDRKHEHYKKHWKHRKYKHDKN